MYDKAHTICRSATERTMDMSAIMQNDRNAHKLNQQHINETKGTDISGCKEYSLRSLLQRKKFYLE